MTEARLDRWLWTARFFKTRALAAEAVAGGLVHLNDARTKPANSRRTGASSPSHSSSSAGHAIQVAACGLHSAGIAKP